MLFMYMDKNKWGYLSDEDPAIVPCKSEENNSDYFESVDAPSASRSRPRSKNKFKFKTVDFVMSSSIQQIHFKALVLV